MNTTTMAHADLSALRTSSQVHSQLSVYPLFNHIVKTRNVSLFYGKKQALNDITFNIPRHRITALIGPSGCGKSTFLRCINRMNDLIDDVSVLGEIFVEETNINDERIDVIDLRRKVGMVFQKSVPFPKSIFENVAYGLRIAGVRNSEIEERVLTSLHKAALWDEVKDRLKDSALALSGGQMQRLCIARAIAIEPQIILMDEPCSALDPKSTAKVEELMLSLKDEYTVVIVTHNMQQAARVSDHTAFFYEGSLVEEGETKQIFSQPQHSKTEDYISGRFG